MIAPLRRAHRVVFTLLAVLLPVLLALALAARRSEPIADPLPAELTDAAAVATE